MILILDEFLNLMSYSFHNSPNPKPDFPTSLCQRSEDLYMFWENYHRLYQAYQHLLQENDTLERRIAEIGQKTVEAEHKENQKIMELARVNDELNVRLKGMRVEVEKRQQECLIVKEENQRLQKFIKQLKEQNNIQEQSIVKISQKLKQIQSTDKQYQTHLQQYQLQVHGLEAKHQQFRQILLQKDQQIQQLEVCNREMKKKCAQIIKKTLRQAKEKVEENVSFALQHSAI